MSRLVASAIVLKPKEVRIVDSFLVTFSCWSNRLVYVPVASSSARFGQKRTQTWFWFHSETHPVLALVHHLTTLSMAAFSYDCHSPVHRHVFIIVSVCVSTLGHLLINVSLWLLPGIEHGDGQCQRLAVSGLWLYEVATVTWACFLSCCLWRCVAWSLTYESQALLTLSASHQTPRGMLQLSWWMISFSPLYMDKGKG